MSANSDSRVATDPPAARARENFLPSLFRRLRYGKTVIVVSGLPRSGTSMTMKMLAAAEVPLAVDEIRSADEDNPKGYFELERVKDLDKASDKTWLRDARGKAVKVISFLLPHLPKDNNYQVLFMNRDLKEVLVSQAKMLQRRSEVSNTSDERMMQLYKDHLLRVKSLIAASEHFECLELEYREAIENPWAHAQRVQKFLGLQAAVVEKMAETVDSELYRNRG